MPRITILLPAYNEAEHIQVCLDSLSEQTYRDFKVLVLDDESRDTTIEFVEKHSEKDSRFELVQLPKSGLVGTLNSGLKSVSSEFLARMDADDICSPKRFERQLEYLEAFKLDVVGSDIVKFGGSVQRHVVQFPARPAQAFAHTLFSTPVAHSAVLAKATAFQNFRYDTEFKHAEDYDLWQRMISSGARFGSVPKSLLAYRVHEKQVSSQHVAYQADRAEAVRCRHQNLIGGLKGSVVDWIEAQCMKLGFHVDYSDQAYFLWLLGRYSHLGLSEKLKGIITPGTLKNVIHQSSERKKRRQAIELE